MQEAVATLQQHTGVKEAIWLKKDKFEVYMDKFLDSASSKILSLSTPKLKTSL